MTIQSQTSNTPLTTINLFSSLKAKTRHLFPLTDLNVRIMMQRHVYSIYKQTWWTLQLQMHDFPSPYAWPASFQCMQPLFPNVDLALQKLGLGLVGVKLSRVSLNSKIRSKNNIFPLGYIQVTDLIHNLCKNNPTNSITNIDQIKINQT